MGPRMSTGPVTIGRYQVRDRLGQGGMGVLYLALDPAIDRLVALKVLRVDNEEMRERFLREARLAARLQHPNIVTIYDVGSHEGQPFIAMEYISGETLAELIQRRAPLAVERKLELMLDACQGLAYAHRHGIIHRDIKPANLMVGRDAGVLKVLDFGIARGADSTLTQIGMLMGTPNYMSPEQIEGRPIDQRSDIFAIGLVFYELLAYRQAFRADTPHAVLHAVLHSNPAALSGIAPDLDRGVGPIVDRAIAKDVQQRYQDLEHMRSDLQKVVARMKTERDQPTMLTPVPGAMPVHHETPHAPPHTPKRTPPPSADMARLAERRAAQIQTHLQAAEQALTSGELDAAMAAAESAALLDQEDVRVMRMFDRIRAATDAREVANLLGIARQQITQGQLTEASQAVHQALQIDGGQREAQQLKVTIERAVEEREQQRRREANAKRALQRVEECIQAGAFEGALRAIAEATGYDPTNADLQAARERVLALVDQRAHEEIAAARAEAASGQHDRALHRLMAFAPWHTAIDQETKALQAQIAEIQRVEEERRQREAEEARRVAEEQARLRAEAEARKKAEEEAARKAEDEKRRKAYEEARRKVDEEKRLRAEAAARKKAEEEAARKAAAEAEARRKAEEEARQRAAAEEARRQAEEAARRKAEEEARQRAAAAAAAEEARKKAAAEEAQRKAAAEAAARKKADDAQRAAAAAAAEDARRKAAAEAAARKQAEDAQRAAAAAAAEDARRKAAAEAAALRKADEAQKAAAAEDARRKAADEAARKKADDAQRAAAAAAAEDARRKTAADAAARKKVEESQRAAAAAGADDARRKAAAAEQARQRAIAGSGAADEATVVVPVLARPPQRPTSSPSNPAASAPPAAKQQPIATQRIPAAPPPVPPPSPLIAVPPVAPTTGDEALRKRLYIGAAVAALVLIAILLGALLFRRSQTDTGALQPKGGTEIAKDANAAEGRSQQNADAHAKPADADEGRQRQAREDRAGSHTTLSRYRQADAGHQPLPRAPPPPSAQRRPESHHRGHRSIPTGQDAARSPRRSREDDAGRRRQGARRRAQRAGADESRSGIPIRGYRVSRCERDERHASRGLGARLPQERGPVPESHHARHHCRPTADAGAARPQTRAAQTGAGAAEAGRSEPYAARPDTASTNAESAAAGSGRRETGDQRDAAAPEHRIWNAGCGPGGRGLADDERGPPEDAARSLQQRQLVRDDDRQLRDRRITHRARSGDRHVRRGPPRHLQGARTDAVPDDTRDLPSAEAQWRLDRH
jgi:eukaryotic-like serine/threonine-protein kinase